MKHSFWRTIPLLFMALFPAQGLLAQTPTSTPTCTQFTDTYGSSSSLNNYNFYNGWTLSTAAALSYQVSSGELQVAPTSGTVYSVAAATNSVFNQTLGDYSVEGDFKLDTVSQGVFGPMFCCDAAASQCYFFQWNGLNGRWEIEKQTGTGYYYPGCVTGNAYTLGTWVHLKVTATGGTFNCWETPESAPGVASGATVQIFTSVTDTVACAGTSGLTAALTTGNAGLRAYNIVSGNILHVQNFTAYNCTSGTLTPTLTNSPTQSPTATVSPTPTSTGTLAPTATATPLSAGCQQFMDTYNNSSSLSNYSYNDGSWNAATAVNLDYSVASGELQETPPTGANVGSYLTVLNSLFNPSLSNYTVEADFKLDNWTSGHGLFGLVFREAATGEAYVFQLNGNPENSQPHWQLEKQLAPGGTSYTYLPGSGFGMGAASPAYTLGTWVHLKVVAQGNLFNCYANTGGGDQLVFSVSDPGTTVYASGSVGIRTSFIYNPNTLHVQNFTATWCGGPVYTGSNPPVSGDFFIYPSPARGSQATVSYNMAQSGQVDLRVWNEKAELVTHMTDSKTAGVQVTPFSIAGFGTGVYFYSLTLTYDSGTVEKLGPKKFVILH